MIPTDEKFSDPTPQELADFAAIESAFAAFPLTEPSANVLAHVRKNAERFVKPSVFEVITTNVRNFFTMPRLALAFSVVAVIGINYAMSRSQTTSLFSSQQENSELSNLSAARTNDPSLSENTDAPNTAALKEFDKAIAAFQAGRYAETEQVFAALMSEYPAFEKRKEVYTYWIEALKKLGRYGLAEKKQKLLEEIENQ